MKCYSRKHFGKYLVSYINVILIVLSLFAISNAWNTATRMRKEEFRIFQNRVDMFVDDFDTKLENMNKMAYQLSAINEFSSSDFTKNKYLEYEVVSHFAEFCNMMSYNAYAFLKYNNYSNIITSDGTVKSLSLYLKELLGEESAGRITQLIEEQSVDGNHPLLIHSENGYVFIVCSLRPYTSARREGCVLTFVLSNADITKWVENFTGKEKGEFILYYDGKAICGEPSLLEDIQITSKLKKIYIEYQIKQEVLFSVSSIFSLKEVARVGAVFMFAILISIIVAYRNYQPIKDMKNKIESLIQSEFENSNKIKKQYEMLQEQMTRLIVNGCYTQYLQEYIYILNLKLEGPLFGVICCKMDKNISDSDDKLLNLKYDSLICDIKLLSDENIQFYTFWENIYELKILVSLNLECQIEDAYMLITELLDVKRINAEVTCSDMVDDLMELKHSIGRTKEQLSFEDEREEKNLNCSTSTEVFDETSVKINQEISQVVKSALVYMNDNYQSFELGLGWIAEKLNVTPAYLSRIIKKQTGKGYKEHLLQIRVEAAKRILKNTEMTILEVCESVGYTSVSNFIQLFQKEEGITPAAYRRKIREENQEFDDSNNTI